MNSLIELGIPPAFYSLMAIVCYLVYARQVRLVTFNITLVINILFVSILSINLYLIFFDTLKLKEVLWSNMFAFVAFNNYMFSNNVNVNEY